MSISDIQRHQRELEDFNNKGYFINEKNIDSRELFLKKPTFPEGVFTPKKPVSGYMFYVKSKFEEMKNEFQSQGKTDVTQVTKQCSQVWNSLSEQDKKKYENMKDQSQVRYEK